MAAALAVLLFVGVASLAGLAIGRGIWHDRHADRMEQARDRLEDRIVPPGERRNQGPMMPGNPGGNGRGNGNGDGSRNDLGNGLGSLLRGAMGLGNVQHGEFTLTGTDGKPVAMTVQRGQVAKVSDTSLTVKSEDGFTATYAVSVDTRRTGANDLASGDTVLVVAEKSGAKAVLVQARR